MSVDLILAYGQSAIYTTLMVAGPILVASLVVGTAISVLQAVTQVQEITLVFVPKILVAFGIVALVGGWMLQMMVAFGTQMFLAIPETGL